MSVQLDWYHQYDVTLSCNLLCLTENLDNIYITLENGHCMKLDIHGQQLWNYPYEYHTETHQLHIVSDSPLTIDTLKQPVSPVYLSRDGELSLCFRQEGTIRCIINSNNTGGPALARTGDLCNVNAAL